MKICKQTNHPIKNFFLDQWHCLTIPNNTMPYHLIYEVLKNNNTANQNAYQDHQNCPKKQNVAVSTNKRGREVARESNKNKSGVPNQGIFYKLCSSCCAATEHLPHSFCFHSIDSG